MSTRSRSAARAWPAMVIALLVAHCDECREADLTAPDGATIEVQAEHSGLTQADSAVITAIVWSEAKELVRYSTILTFTTSQGHLCPVRGSCSILAPVLTAKTDTVGFAQAYLFPGSDTGEVTLKVTSGGAVGTARVRVVAPPGKDTTKS